MKYIDFYNNYKDQIFSYFFYNLNQDRYLAEDLTSDTFLKGFEKFEGYDKNRKFSTWIFTIARNTLYDYYRKKKIDISIDEEMEMSFTEFIRYEEDFEKKIDTSIHIEQVYLALENIPEGQRDMIVMKYIQELSTKEISNMTGKTEANIRKTLSRWLLALQRIPTFTS